MLLQVASLPVIEHSTGLRFGAYPTSLLSGQAVSLGDHIGIKAVLILRKAQESKHLDVQDFDWVRGGASPNWRLINDEEIRLFDKGLEMLDGDIAAVDCLLDDLLPRTPSHA